MNNSAIIFDCERMRSPNTGLYFFCDMLAESLSKESDQHQKDIAFYVPKRYKGRW